ncbi:MAG: PEP-CTERM sorting domain-containing protein [Luteolibacter sp.]
MPDAFGSQFSSENKSKTKKIMKLRNLIAFGVTMFAAQSQGAVGYFGNFYVVTTLNGGGNVFNQVLSPANNTSNADGGFGLTADGVNPSLGFFGTIDLGASGSLALKGFEMNTYNDNGDSVNSASLFYRVTKVGDTPSGFSNILMSSPTSTSGNDKFWQKTDGSVDLTSGLSNGDYTIDFYVQNDASFTGGGGGTFVMNNWNSTSGPSGSFTVVPEPSAAALGLVGACLLLRRRRI